MAQRNGSNGIVFFSRAMGTIIIVLLLVIEGMFFMGAANVESGTHPLARGTFIQSYLVKGWGDREWASELGYLKEAGMDYIILQSTADRSDGGMLRTIYPTNLPGAGIYDGYTDVVDACLRNAEAVGFRVFLGLNSDSQWWDKYAYDPGWLYTMMQEGNAVADELYDNYKGKYPEAFYGWYWPWEVDNIHFKSRITQSRLSNAINITLSHLDSTGRRLPLMISPFTNYRLGGAKEYSGMWEYVFFNTDFKEGDIFCPQDSVGAGGLDTRMLKIWFSAFRRAVNTKPGLMLWSNVEIFDYTSWNSATADRFAEQMKNVQPYVDNIVTFAYSHYYSPNITDRGFHNAYLDYVRSGKLQNSNPGVPVNPRKQALDDGGVFLSWDAPQNSHSICGYIIYRGGKFLKRIQVERTGSDSIKPPDVFYIDSSRGHNISGRYEIISYDFSGNISNKASFD